MYSHLSQARWAYPSSLSDPLHYPLSIAFYSNLEHTYFLLFSQVDCSLFSSASIISFIIFTEQISCIYIFLITFYWELEPSYFLSHFHFLLVWYWKLCQKLSFGPALFLSRFHTPPFSNFPPKNYSLFIWCAPRSPVRPSQLVFPTDSWLQIPASVPHLWLKDVIDGNSRSIGRSTLLRTKNSFDAAKVELSQLIQAVALINQIGPFYKNRPLALRQSKKLGPSWVEYVFIGSVWEVSRWLLISQNHPPKKAKISVREDT